MRPNCPGARHYSYPLDFEWLIPSGVHTQGSLTRSRLFIPSYGLSSNDQTYRIVFKSCAPYEKLCSNTSILIGTTPSDLVAILAGGKIISDFVDI